MLNIGIISEKKIPKIQALIVITYDNLLRNRDGNENAARMRFLLRNENKNPSERRIVVDSPTAK